MEDRIVAVVPKNAREEIRVMLREYRGHRTVDVRVWARGNDGEPVPTGKGVGIKPALLPELIAAMIDAEREARAMGLMETDA